MSPLRSVTPVRAAAIASAVTALVASGLTAAQAAPVPARSAAPASSAPSRPGSDSAERKALADAAVPRRFPNGLESAPKRGKQSFLLTLDRSSTSAVTRSNRGKSRATIKRAATTQRNRIAEMQRAVVADLPSDSAVLYRTHALAAGVAVRTDASNLERLRRIDGVTAVYPIATKKLLNSYAVPHQGAPQVWSTYGDRGDDTTIAIIDSGIDYTHTDFGGPGTASAFATAKSSAQQTNPTVFPTAKVDGYDFAGDDYDPASKVVANRTPKPDANPLDCEGHGTHVAGTAAGYGTNADGSTYTGAYSTSTPFDSMKIGPGMAPLAYLYAFRVFGCTGSTDLTGAALDRAIDPNDDGDTGDHVDVVNLSLGTDFAPPGGDADTLLVKKATDAGVNVVAAAGNAGDVYDVAGTPANEPSAISVAASSDAEAVVDGLVVTAPAAAKYPAERSAAYDYATDPDLAGTVAKLSEDNTFGCTALTAQDAAAVKGKIAFLEWHDAAPECGSATRADNLTKAGAIGFVFGSDSEAFSAGITGNATIPGVLVAKSGADAIRTQLNAGTTVTIGSTQANAVRQSDDGLNEQIASFTSRGVRGKDGLKPDVAAVGQTVFSAKSGSGTDGLSESGTSMATPMTAGLAALIASAHPDWTPAQVKADIMNTAGQDLYTGPNKTGDEYAPNRVGSGRIDAKAALDNSVLAYTSGTGVPVGTVSASFGPVAVTAATTTLQKTITVQNTGLSSATFATDYVERTTVPGADYTVSPDSVTVDARSQATVTVTLTLTRSQLTKTIDPTVDRLTPLLDDDGALVPVPRQYVADASGLVTLTPTSGATVPLRVPVYAAPRPASTMTSPSGLLLPGGVTPSAKLGVTGSGLNQGAGDTRVRSAVAGFELQANSGLAPTCTTTVTDNCVHNAGERAADLKYVGATTSVPQDLVDELDPLSDSLAYFSLTTQAAWRNPSGFVNFEVYIDSTGDNIPDAVTYTTRVPQGALDDPTDILVAVTESLDPKAEQPILDIEPLNGSYGNIDTAVFDSDTQVLPVLIGRLPGITETKSRIRYSVFSGIGSDYVVDSVGGLNLNTGQLVSPRTMNVLRPGVTVTGSTLIDQSSPLLYLDPPGSLNVRRDNGTYAADGALGALVVHFQNGEGQKARPVALSRGTTSATLKLTPTTVKAGAKIAVAVTVTGTAGTTPTGTVFLQRYQAGQTATNVASATLSGGKASRTIVQGSRGTFYYRLYYPGDSYNAATYSATITVRAT